jgi:hypothetical protein
VVEFASGFIGLAYPVNPVLFLGTLLCKAMGEAHVQEQGERSGGTF